MVGKRFFRSQVTDLAWTPDGFTLLAASSDGACGERAGWAAATRMAVNVALPSTVLQPPCPQLMHGCARS